MKKKKKSTKHVDAATARWEGTPRERRYRDRLEGLRVLADHPEGLTSLQFYDARWPDGKAERKWGTANRYLLRILEAFPRSIRREGDARREGEGLWKITRTGSAILRRLDSKPDPDSGEEEVRSVGRPKDPTPPVALPKNATTRQKALILRKHNWPITAIGKRLGVSRQAISQLLRPRK